MSEAVYDLASLTQTMGDVPKLTRKGTGRPEAPNPLLDHVKTLANKRDVAQTFKFAAGTHAALTERVKAITNDLRRAGRKLGVTVRIHTTVDQSSKSAEITFWVIDLVKRERKPKTSEASE